MLIEWVVTDLFASRDTGFCFRCMAFKAPRTFLLHPILLNLDPKCSQCLCDTVSICGLHWPLLNKKTWFIWTTRYKVICVHFALPQVCPFPPHTSSTKHKLGPLKYSLPPRRAFQVIPSLHSLLSEIHLCKKKCLNSAYPLKVMNQFHTQLLTPCFLETLTPGSFFSTF